MCYTDFRSCLWFRPGLRVLQENTVGKRRRKSVCVGEGADEEGFKEEKVSSASSISTSSVQATSVLSAGFSRRLSSNSFLQSMSSLC